MQKYRLPVEHQAKFLGSNARRLYKIQAPQKIIRDRATEIERPSWWPSEEEIRAALEPEAAVTRGQREKSGARYPCPVPRRGGTRPALDP